MDKNDFDLDIDFEEEYGFDPKDFLSEDDDFDYSDILDEDDPTEDMDATKAYHFDQTPDQNADDDISDADEDLAADFPEHPDHDDEQQDYPDEEAPQAYDAPEEEQDGQEYDIEEYDEEPEQEQGTKKKGGLKLPKLGGKGKSKKAKSKASDPVKKSVFSKLLDMYMEPVNRYKEESEVLDPLDPRYVRRRKREKKRIFKEVYLPAIIAGLALLLILSFIVGSISNALTVKKNKDSAAQVEAQQQASAADAAEVEFKRTMAQVESLVTGYDYQGAIDLLNEYLNGYNGSNNTFREQAVAKQAALVNEQNQLVELKDVTTIPNLSFHVLMADASRACNKDVSGADMAGLYNKNFVSVEEFSRILNQLYSSNYVLVDFDSFVYKATGVDGNDEFGAKSIYLPQGKKPV